MENKLSELFKEFLNSEKAAGYNYMFSNLPGDG
jgi:hypothetical protein